LVPSNPLQTRHSDRGQTIYLKSARGAPARVVPLKRTLLPVPGVWE